MENYKKPKHDFRQDRKTEAGVLGENSLDVRLGPKLNGELEVIKTFTRLLILQE